MTVQELIDVSPWLEAIEVIVRQNGESKWLYGFRIGKNVHIYPSEQGAEARELRQLKEYTPYPNKQVVVLKDGDIVNVSPAHDSWGKTLTLKVMCRNVHGKIPEEIGNLQICKILPRRVPGYSQLTDIGHTYEINCYPPEETKKFERMARVTETRQQASKPSEIEDSGQMTLEDLMRATQ